MKEIIFIRHATAEIGNPDDDINRNLTPKGVYESENIAMLLSRLQKQVDLIITSDAIRALETADNIQGSAYQHTDRIVDSRLYTGDKADYLKSIRKIDEKYQSVMIIGHNPVIRETAAYFMDVNLTNICFPKASVYSFRIDCDSWKSVSNKYSELTLYIKREHIEQLSATNRDKKKIELLEDYYNSTEKLLNSIKANGFKTAQTHDLRVMNRKWQSIIDFSIPNAVELDETISAFMQKTGKFRDLCVQTKLLNKSNSEKNIYNYWKKKKTENKNKLSKEVHQILNEDMKRDYLAFARNVMTRNGYFSEGNLRQDILQSLGQLKLKREVSIEKDACELHKFRLKVKDVRYKIEFYNDFFLNFDFNADKLVFLHKNLGIIRDCQKLIQKINRQKSHFKTEEVENTIRNIDLILQKTWGSVQLFLDENNYFDLQTGG
ncbi:MAG TPA: CHAD domain-containing protein [Thermotogota bacterium]|nr:CHAD domain-containing protein [Thermotogota bacterium]